jgi:hypothetical protein
VSGVRGSGTGYRGSGFCRMAGNGHPTELHSQDEGDCRLIFIGDYIDYGPSSREVVDALLQINKEFDCVFMAGNHEDLMLQYLKGSDTFEQFGNV